MKNLKVILRNDTGFVFEAHKFVIKEGFIYFERDGKTIALFNAADVVAVLENAE